MAWATAKTRSGQTAGRSAKTFGPGSYLCALSSYTPIVAKGSAQAIHGGLKALSTGDALNAVPTNIVVTKGIGKLLFVMNAGSDTSGTITVTGTSVDRETGVETASDTEDIVVDGVTTDASDTDANGNTRWSFTNAYITSKWFTGSVTISTADTTWTDVDTYHVSFEQFNDTAQYVLDTFDINLYTNNVAAELDAYLYSVDVTGSTVTVTREASLNTGSTTNNVPYRLRRGNIGKALRGATDGIFVDLYPSGNSHIEDLTVKVWARIIGSGTDITSLQSRGMTREAVFSFVTPVASKDYLLDGVPVGATITECYAIVQAATSVVFSVVMRARSAPFSSGTNIVNAQTATTTGGTKTLASTTYTADNVLRLTTGTVTGTPGELLVILKYTVDA